MGEMDNKHISEYIYNLSDGGKWHRDKMKQESVSEELRVGRWLHLT